MATLVTCVVDTGGTGDYTSLSTAETANFGATGADLVENDEYVEVTWICTNGQAETTPVEINGYTTSSTNSITITVPKRYRMPRVWVSGNYARIETVAISGLYVIDTSHITIVGAAVKNSPTASWRYAMSVTSTSGNSVGITFKSCIGNVAANIDNTPAFRVTKSGDNSSSATFISCLAIREGTVPTTYGFSLNPNNGIIKLLGCTSVNAPIAFQQNSGTVIAKNCLAADCTTGFDGTFDSSSTHNASTAGDAPGSNAIDLSGTPLNRIFKDPNNGDYKPIHRLIIQRGVDLRSEGVTEDLLGNRRESRPSIGALEHAQVLPGPIWQKIKGRWYKIN